MDRRLIVIDLFEGAEELDVVGPWEVLASWTQAHPDDGWRVVMATDDGRPRTCRKGLALTPTASWSDLPLPDMLVEPGGRGSRVRLKETAHLARMRDIADSGATMTSVCTGALVYAAAGLLAGRPAVTHHGVFDELLALEPTVDLRRDDRWVDDGDVVTAGGVSAGIDMALHLVGRFAGPQRAQQVQERIEYFPRPPVWSPS